MLNVPQYSWLQGDPPTHVREAWLRFDCTGAHSSMAVLCLRSADNIWHFAKDIDAYHLGAPAHHPITHWQPFERKVDQSKPKFTHEDLYGSHRYHIIAVAVPPKGQEPCSFEYDRILTRDTLLDHVSDWLSLKEHIASEMSLQTGVIMTAQSVRILTSHYIGKANHSNPDFTIQGVTESDYEQALRVARILSFAFSQKEDSPWWNIAQVLRQYLRQYIPYETNKLDGTRPIPFNKEIIDSIISLFRSVSSTPPDSNPVEYAPIIQTPIVEDLPFSAIPLGGFIDRS